MGKRGCLFVPGMLGALVVMAAALAVVMAANIGVLDATAEVEQEQEQEQNWALTDAESEADLQLQQLAAEADADEADDTHAAMRFSLSRVQTEAEMEAEVEAEAEAAADAAARADAELEATAEMAAEAEMEAESEAATSMGATIRVHHRALNAAANARFAVESRWFSWNKAGAAHAGLLDAALATLTQNEGADTVKRVFDRAPLLAGIEWNDRPGGSDAHPSDEPLDADTFHRSYEYHGAHHELVHNVHFGCLQHFHSQCPAVQRLDLQNEFGDDRFVFSNSEVRDLIVGQLRYWWLNAVDAQLQSGGPTQRAPKKNAPAKPPAKGSKPVDAKAAAAAAAATAAAAEPQRMPAPVTPSKDANFALGHILATVQDAWTKSHVLRSVEEVHSEAAAEIDNDSRSSSLAERCGRVHYFAGGDAQEGNAAKALEDPQSSADFYTCAHYYSYVVLKAFERCATASVASPDAIEDQTRWCTFESALKPVLEEGVYALAAEHEASPAGGSMADYASPRIDRLGYRKVTYDVAGVGGVAVWEPTSSKLWRALGADDLQVALCHTVKGKVRNFNGVTYRDETFKDFQNVVRGGRLLQPVLCTVDSRASRRTGPYWVSSKSGTCEKHGWRLGAGCGSHKSCRPSKVGGCKGRCMCGRRRGCRCMQLLDKTRQKCKNRVSDIDEPM